MTTRRFIFLLPLILCLAACGPKKPPESSVEAFAPLPVRLEVVVDITTQRWLKLDGERHYCFNANDEVLTKAALSLREESERIRRNVLRYGPMIEQDLDRLKKRGDAAGISDFVVLRTSLQTVVVHGDNLTHFGEISSWPVEQPLREHYCKNMLGAFTNVIIGYNELTNNWSRIHEAYFPQGDLISSF